VIASAVLWAVCPGSSWIQALGFWPLNLMQYRLAHKKIAGGMQRFRAGIEPAEAEHERDVRAQQAANGWRPTPVVRVRKSDQRKVLPVVD